DLFFFQAEDGIRDFHVTGVQTCALPISPSWLAPATGRGTAEGDRRRGGADAWRMAGPVCRGRGVAGSDVRQRHAADRGRIDGGRRGAWTAAARRTPAHPLEGFRSRRLAPAGGGCAGP